ncbi:aromatic compound dioxygenase [Xylariomycetidae sp. FL0641]|nr:aromatic compound dioxygenase [Xylariomycetidae sp. FL0641]
MGEKLQYDPSFTDSVIAATGPKASPRLKQIMPSLLRHLHDFAREVDLTIAEWTAGVEMINEAGRMSDDKRNETQLLCDVLGLESLVDEISSKLLQQESLSNSSTNGAAVEPPPLATPAPVATPSAVLGPFYRANAPVQPADTSIIYAPPDSAWMAAAKPLTARVTGTVRDSVSGAPIPGAVLDVWLAGPNGLYEQQDAGAPDMNLRGRFATDGQGAYAFRALRPTAYPIPDDGPAGRLLGLLDRHPYRPAHIHFLVVADGYRPLTTQVFDEEDAYTRDDAVFAVKRELLVKFKRREGDEETRWELEYDFSLCPVGQGQVVENGKH